MCVRVCCFQRGDREERWRLIVFFGNLMCCFQRRVVCSLVHINEPGTMGIVSGTVEVVNTVLSAEIRVHGRFRMWMSLALCL